MNHKYLKLLVILSGQLLTIMDIFIINVSIPSIQHDLGALNGEMQLMIASYLIGFASFLITGGRLGDLFGRKKIFIWGLVFFMLSSVACGISSGAVQLASARFVQGISAALMSPQVLSIIQILFPRNEERAKAMGWYGITIGAGTVLGQFLGGYLSSSAWMNESWRLIFLVNVPVCLPAIFFSIKILTESEVIPENRKLNLSGVIILAVGLFCFTYALTSSEHPGFQLKNVIIMMISAITLIYFIKNQKIRMERGLPYLLDLRLFRFRNFNLGILAVSFFFIMLDSYFYILSVFFQDGLKIGALKAGEIIVFQGLGFILASFFSAKLIIRYGKMFLAAGLIMIIIILVLQMMLFDMEISFFTLCVMLFLHGVGVGCIIPSLAGIALSGVPETLAGNASGVYNTFQQAAAIAGIIVVGSIFYCFLGSEPSAEDYHYAFSMALAVNIFCITAVLVCLFRVPDKVFPKIK